MKKFVSISILSAVTTIAAETTPPVAEWGEKEIPTGIQISLESVKTNYFLGENVVLYYCIKNAGTDAFKISVGGDYRGSTRADRFHVTAISSDGKKVSDPTPNMRSFGGGLTPNSDVKPGKAWFENVYVIEYCRFEEPGIYTVHVFHDLGFGEKRDHDPREVSLAVQLRAPTEEQARAILAMDEKATPAYSNTWGEKATPRLDWSCLRHPAFLPALVERAKNGNQNALEGIASIRTLEATRVMVDLLNHSNAAFASKAAARIEARLPHPTNEFQESLGSLRRGFLVENAWSEKLAPPVREFCVRLLETNTRGNFLLAASLLKRIGTPRETPALWRALDFALAQTNSEFLNDIRWPSPIRACDELLGAVLAIDPEKDVAPGKIQSPADALLFLAKRAGGERVLSKEEEQTFSRLMRDPAPYLRAKAIENLPRRIPAALTDDVTQRLADSNVGVQNFAFEAARRMNEPQQRDIALNVLRSANEEWLLRGANDVAMKYGARYECGMAWAARLVKARDMNDYRSHEALRHLFQLTTGRLSGGSFRLDEEDCTALRKRWEEFLTANHDKIQAVHIFKWGEDLPTDLLPPDWTLNP